MRDIEPYYIRNAMQLWMKHGFEYRVILDEYNYLIGIKRELRIKPLNKLSNFELRGFPYDLDEFLGLSCESDARRYLSELAPDQVDKLIRKINNEFVENALIECLRVKNADSKRQIAEYRQQQKISFPINPDSCTGGGHTLQNKVLTTSRF